MSGRRRRALVAGLTVVMVGGAAVVARERGRECGDDVLTRPAASSTTPFLDADRRAEQPDERRDALVASLSATAGRLGEVVGAVGYDYDQWAQLSAFDEGLGVRTGDDPAFTMLDDDLAPRWSVRVTTARSTYDAGAGRYVVATLPPARAPEVVVLDASTGERRWCASLPGDALARGDEVSTAITADGDVVLARPSPGGTTVSRLGDGGTTRWTTELAAGGDATALLEDRVVVGGVARSVLLDASARATLPADRGLTWLDPDDGTETASLPTEAGTGLHLLGVAGGQAVVERWGPSGGALAGVLPTGEEAWRVEPAPGRLFDAALRSGRVVVRSGTDWAAYDASDGSLLWSREVPEQPQLLPYGFALGDAPLLDADRLLLGTTTALRTLDLRDGTLATLAELPVDGISTTYWPYAVTLTDDLLAVATNSGAVVVRLPAPVA